MKAYQVFYVVKENRRERQEHLFITAASAKEAKQKCKEIVFEKFRKHAFRTKAIRTDDKKYIGVTIDLISK